MPNLSDMELCIEYISSSENVEIAFSRYSEILKNDGYDKAVYTLITDHPSLNLPATHGIATSYPQDWLEHYNEKLYFHEDPVVIRGSRNRTPFFWDDLYYDRNFSKKSLDILRQGADAGIRDGTGITFTGAAGELSGIAIAKSENGDKKKEYDYLAKAHFISTFFHETFINLHSEKVLLPKFTSREKDVLLWACEGKSDQLISDKLTISIDTIRFHWKNIFRKLETKNKTHAVAKSIRLGVISPKYLKP